jgi:hypothetical protein
MTPERKIAENKDLKAALYLKKFCELFLQN